MNYCLAKIKNVLSEYKKQLKDVKSCSASNVFM